MSWRKKGLGTFSSNKTRRINYVKEIAPDTISIQ
jgi:hypothetical protein